MKNTIFISDLHLPYQHRDAFSFLKLMKREYDIKIAKNVGDVADNHTASYHEVEYQTLSAKEEYDATYASMQELSGIFPEMTVTLGNHCLLNRRKAKTAGIPEDHLKSYNDIYGVNWKWVDKDYFNIEGKHNCLMTHAMSSNTLTNAKIHSHSTVGGHHHSVYGLEYFADTEFLRFSMTVGCLIDPHSPAFNYNKSSSKRPILGVGCLLDNQPWLRPMTLKRSGRWDGRV